MSLGIDRDFLTQGAIALALCLGGWMFLVRPQSEELRLLESEIARWKAVVATTDRAAIERVVSLAPSLRQTADEIAARGLMADSYQIYKRVQALAETCSVAVNNLRPGPDPGRAKDKAFTASRVDMTVDGEYENIARFLEGLDRMGAYLRPVSVQLTPTKAETPTFTSMQLSFELLRFTLPDELDKQVRSAPS